MKTEATALIVARFLILSVICSDSVIKDDQDDDSLVAGLELSLRSDDNRHENCFFPIFLHHFSLRSMDILKLIFAFRAEACPLITHGPDITAEMKRE